MNFNNYTIKSQEAIQKATEIALGNEQQAIETGHLLKAIQSTDENVISFITKKLNINTVLLDSRLEEVLQSYPKVSGQQPYLSNETNSALAKATGYLKEFNDDYIAIEHLLLGILAGKDPVSQLMKDAGFVKKDLVKAIQELRGGSTVSDQNAEGKYQSLQRYSIWAPSFWCT